MPAGAIFLPIRIGFIILNKRFFKSLFKIIIFFFGAPIQNKNIFLHCDRIAVENVQWYISNYFFVSCCTFFQKLMEKRKEIGKKVILYILSHYSVAYACYLFMLSDIFQFANILKLIAYTDTKTHTHKTWH